MGISSAALTVVVVGVVVVGVVVARWATCSNAATKPLAGPNLLRLRDVAELGRATVAAEYSLAGCLLAVVGGSVHPMPPLVGVQPSHIARKRLAVCS